MTTRVMTRTEFLQWMASSEERAAHTDRWALLLFSTCAARIELRGEDYEVIRMESRLTDEDGCILESIEWNETDSFLWYEPPYNWLVHTIAALNLMDESAADALLAKAKAQMEQEQVPGVR